MKCGITNSILTFALGALAVVSVILVLRTVIQTRELQKTTTQAAVENSYLTQAQTLFNDVAVYNQKYPSVEITKLLQTVQTRPAIAK